MNELIIFTLWLARCWFGCTCLFVRLHETVAAVVMKLSQ